MNTLRTSPADAATPIGMTLIGESELISVEGGHPLVALLWRIVVAVGGSAVAGAITGAGTYALEQM